MYLGILFLAWNQKNSNYLLQFSVVEFKIWHEMFKVQWLQERRLLFTIISIVSTLIRNFVDGFQVESKTSHLISYGLQFMVEVLYVIAPVIKSDENKRQ
jgi:hypothetical protein